MEGKELCFQIHDNAKLAVTNTSMSNFKEYGIRMETQKYVDGTGAKAGGVELLRDVAEVRIEECKFENNGKGDIFLQARSSVALFSKQEGISSADN